MYAIAVILSVSLCCCVFRRSSICRPAEWRLSIPPDNPPRIKLYVTDRRRAVAKFGGCWQHCGFSGGRCPGSPHKALYPVIFLAGGKVSSSRMPSKEEIDSTSAKNCVTSESSPIPFAADELPAQSGDLAFTT